MGRAVSGGKPKGRPAAWWLFVAVAMELGAGLLAYFGGQTLTWIAFAGRARMHVYRLACPTPRARHADAEEDRLRVTARPDTEKLFQAIDAQMKAIDRFVNDFTYLNEQNALQGGAPDPRTVPALAELLEAVCECEGEAGEEATLAAERLIADMGARAVPYSPEEARLFNILPASIRPHALAPALVSLRTGPCCTAARLPCGWPPHRVKPPQRRAATARKREAKRMRYIGFDMGDGESAVAIFEQGSGIEPVIQPLNGSRSLLSAVGTIGGEIVVGEQAYTSTLAQGLSVRFKSRFTDDPRSYDTIVLFVRGVLRALNDGTVYREGDRFVVGCPAGWNAAARTRYGDLLVRAGVRNPQVISESRAAFLYAKYAKPVALDLDLLKQSALVVDIGSSTLDFAYIVDGRETGWAPSGPHLGADDGRGASAPRGGAQPQPRRIRRVSNKAPSVQLLRIEPEA
jgi:hypothetical protein